ncbi:uncharacterized protein K441DRAFT_208564 [Cenococcum geophilum 1.58]|uniref:uncharacterized protein n=1 Tax=Cenococcum geophilum 1.58 TaxID=794803 RepID=UPI00358DF1DE|nr:hypothetical protein K441DRAFT_208564 [Cenococcum geophilum 1.58]
MRRRRTARRVCISTSLHLILIETGAFFSVLFILASRTGLLLSSFRLLMLHNRVEAFIYGTERCKRQSLEAFVSEEIACWPVPRGCTQTIDFLGPLPLIRYALYFPA